MEDQTVTTTILHYVEHYQKWWLIQIEENPSRVVLETSLIVLVLFLLFKRPNNKKQESKLSQREVDDLLNDWTPEPLVNMDDACKVAGGQNDIVLIKQKLGATITTNNDDVLIDFVTFDFLGFSCDDDVKEQCVATLDAVGCGSCGPRGFYGTLDQHLELEKTIADLFGVEECITYSDAASTVSSVIPAFAKRTDLCIVDEACYDPILTGLFLSRCKTVYFKHNDMADLERILQEIAVNDQKNGTSPRSQRRFIVLEGIYRNVGDVCDLKRIVELKKEHHVRIILDESFSFGVLGATGRGVTEHLDVPLTDVEIICGGLNTSCGSVGGFSIGSEPEIVEHQKLSAAGYTYSASAPPFVCKAATIALQKLLKDPSMCQTVRKNAELLHDGLTDDSTNMLEITSDPCSPICIIQLKEHVVQSIADEFEEGQNQRENMERAAIQTIVNILIADHGIFAVASKYNLHHLYVESKKTNSKNGPCKPINSLRLSISKLHTKEQINQAVSSLLAVSAQVCRDMYGEDVVNQPGTKKGTQKKEKKKKKSVTSTKKKSRNKSVGRS
jgi:serine palmitoyltransferase